MQSDEALWRAVVAQAFIDAEMKVSEPKPDASKARITELANKARDRDEARRWLLEDGPDFQAVCHAAGLDPECVRMYARTRLIGCDGHLVIRTSSSLGTIGRSPSKSP